MKLIFLKVFQVTLALNFNPVAEQVVGISSSGISS
jgi:hypothetical protein